MYSATDETSFEYQTVAVTVTVPSGRSSGSDQLKVSFFACTNSSVTDAAAGPRSLLGP